MVKKRVYYEESTEELWLTLETQKNYISSELIDVFVYRLIVNGYNPRYTFNQSNGCYDITISKDYSLKNLDTETIKTCVETFQNDIDTILIECQKFIEWLETL